MFAHFVVAYMMCTAHGLFLKMLDHPPLVYVAVECMLLGGDLLIVATL